MVRNYVWLTLRVLFGLYFIAATLLVVISFEGRQPDEVDPDANAFVMALNASGFVNPALIAVFLVAGCLLLFARTAPLGLVMLAGPVCVIAGFHLFLTHSYVWGSIWPIWWALLAWHHRSAFVPLWSWKPDPA